MQNKNVHAYFCNLLENFGKTSKIYICILSREFLYFLSFVNFFFKYSYAIKKKLLTALKINMPFSTSYFT